MSHATERKGELCKEKRHMYGFLSLVDHTQWLWRETQSKYQVTLTKPMSVIFEQGINTFSWLPVYGASEYVAKLNKGKPFGIAVSTIELEEGKKCYYTQSTDGLANGLHTISFTARTNKDALSDWTDVLSFYMNKTNTLSRPELSNSFAVCSNDGFDTITYTVK